MESGGRLDTRKQVPSTAQRLVDAPCQHNGLGLLVSGAIAINASVDLRARDGLSTSLIARTPGAVVLNFMPTGLVNRAPTLKIVTGLKSQRALLRGYTRENADGLKCLNSIMASRTRLDPLATWVKMVHNAINGEATNGNDDQVKW